MSVALDAVEISLAVDCGDDCRAFAEPLFEQLAGGAYDECSTMALDATVDEWRATHRTARKRSSRAERLGYTVAAVRRHEHVDAIYAVNTSLVERQGRPMSNGYRLRPSGTPDPPWPCPRHGVHPYGVLDAAGVLVAYAWIYRAGDLALVSQILGHGDHLASDVMYLLAEGVVRHERALGGWLVYNRHDSGTEGLRFYKQRVGFAPRMVEWKR